MNTRKLVVVDGRVFATEAADRGMGRYVDYVAETLRDCGCEVLVLVPPPNVPPRAFSAGIRTEAFALEDDPLLSTLRLNRFLINRRASAYLDATPFLPPMRYDIYACPVIAVLFDLIPMRFPKDYFDPTYGPWPLDVYVNGLARVQKADHVIAISEYVKGHALRYLGVPTQECSVIAPGVAKPYLDCAKALPSERSTNMATCIQGAHRSKNFPGAIGFLERLSLAASCDINVIVPTPTQRRLVEDVRDSRVERVHVTDSISETRKFKLQIQARAVLHLSLDEGYGIPLVEALCLHRPVVCVDNAINREIVSGTGDPRNAGILLLEDPTLASHRDLDQAADFVRTGPLDSYGEGRRAVLERLLNDLAEAPSTMATVLTLARDRYDAWHAQVRLGIVAPTEIGSCGVSDYCFALMRSTSPRYVMLLGSAPRELQLLRQLRLLPVALLEEARERTGGVLFNLAVSDSLTRAFDAIAEQSIPDDVLVVHDAGSYLPGLLMQAAAKGDERLLFERYLANEPDVVHALSKRWLANPQHDPSHSGELFLNLDGAYESRWLRAFRGRIVSHHASFAADPVNRVQGVLSMLSPRSEILQRSSYAPMPIDSRATPGAVRLATKMRWALGLDRGDLLVCCAGSIVRGKYLDVVADVLARFSNADHRGLCNTRLLLAGRVFDESLFAEMRATFAAHNAEERLLQVVESSEVRYDALLLASDVIVAFREQRRIQMSHSYVRALALGRPIISNAGAGFDDGALLCRDDHLAEDLDMHLTNLSRSASVVRDLARSARSRFLARHTLDAFFDALAKRTDVVALV